ncbi:MAG: hypothetical protein M1818_006612 [Claussenomyces sp. TS43310]|nr:MAG: hypothetical protein M1818_006953 [Claussenomyces sp. TS43310]KAI9735035.1 MAG: hypothetical protein M1818_006612 [Claussenomyces sp. TS43310]
MDFVQRWEALQRHTDTSNHLIEELMYYCKHVETSLRNENSRLKQELEDATLDLEDARKSRRELQLECNIAKQRLSQFSMDNDNLKKRNPYVMVLIDGDGMIFHEDFVRLGVDGGKMAATALRNAVLEQYSDLPDDAEIIAKVCANITGLAKAMKRDGSLENPQDFREFTLGFTQGKASFDFVDVGHGKERADSKIKESTRWNLRNHNCRHILLGISHDAGYAPFLDEVLRDESMSQRVAIVEGPPVVRELSQTGARVIQFQKVFRQDKLIDRNASPAPPSTWAGVTSISTPTTVPTLLTVKNDNAYGRPKSVWNPGPRGLDEPITVNAAVLDKIKRRTGSNKLCNNHYLRGPCAKGDECCFEHNYKATEEDLKAISFLTRLNPCDNGQDCELEHCIYGHNCGSTINGVCAQFNCRFSKDQHPPGTIIKHPRKYDKECY